MRSSVASRHAARTGAGVAHTARNACATCSSRPPLLHVSPSSLRGTHAITHAFFTEGRSKEPRVPMGVLEPPAPVVVPGPAYQQSETPYKYDSWDNEPVDSLRDFSERHKKVLDHFPAALGVDDFMARVEVALSKYGFTGDNSIGMTNLCRDEVTAVLKDKIEAVFGSSFNTNGLGGVLTCGVTGIGAGLSHSPVCTDSGRERYVFFTFPHIAVSPDGTLGPISRPGRPGDSCACGALIKCLGEFKAEGLSRNCKVPGVHEPLDPEYSILKQRLARRIRFEQLDADKMSLADLTKIAERTITDDLEYLIEKCVDIKKADFAVVAGIQIHNWAPDFNTDTPSFEFVAPTKVYACVNGKYSYIDLLAVPSLSPRQMTRLAEQSMGMDVEENEGIAGNGAVSYFGTSTLLEIPKRYLARRIGDLFETTTVISKDATLPVNPVPFGTPASKWPRGPRENLENFHPSFDPNVPVTATPAADAESSPEAESAPVAVAAATVEATDAKAEVEMVKEEVKEEVTEAKEEVEEVTEATEEVKEEVKAEVAASS